MSSRAHHPVERDSAEPAADGARAPGSGESYVKGVDDAVSREVLVPALAEPSPPGGEVAAAVAADDDDDDDAEEVVPEPDSVPPRVAELAEPESLTSAVEPSAPAAGALAAASVADTVEPPAVAERRSSRPPPLKEELAPTGERRSSRPPPLKEELPPAGERRSSRPPPLRELTADELAATSAEMTADELERAAGLTPARAPQVGVAAERTAFEPPWVDEVPDPVTPYEQRVSETVKVADLPPVEQLRGRVLANRYLAEEVAEITASSISYRAYHLALDRAVTVRVLLRGLAGSDEACQDVRRVAAAASALDSPYLAKTLDFGVLSDGWPYLVTETFQGPTLSAILAAEGKFVLRRVLHIGKQLALGLAAAHDKGILHGLLCPDNVLVVEPGSSAEIARILGFGVARSRGTAPEPPRSGVYGVPFYVSPEQAACRPIDARSDIYSLGILLYEMMTGAPPFSDGDFAGVLCQHLDDDAPSPSTKLPSPGALAKALDAIVERCLRKEPEKRYQTASELADDLVRLEAAAARNKRRPMPEVQKPTTTIHSPHRKVEMADTPEAKVIVHDDIDEAASPEPPEAAPARRSSPPAPRPPMPSSPGLGAKPARPAAASASSRSALAATRAPGSAAGRVRVDQATIKISAMDRERFVVERIEDTPGSSGVMGWLERSMAMVRRLLGAPTRGGGSR
jgi:eukaryotic-like serine/threonine-protein kinase